MFKYIERFLDQNVISDLSVIFFTDGCDTCNSSIVINQSLEQLKQTIIKRELAARFLTIGFTSAHDAVFMNKIAQAGTELGNFFYINTEQSNYPEQIKECMQNSLTMAASTSVDGLPLSL